ncbi:MAG: VanZ family protein [Acholeplasmatales bacterium]|nr:VanZ family protein [Acholeplasmatales bacterium]
MKKFKIFLLAFYIFIALLLIYEAALPSNVSAKQNKFFKNIINNISKIFIRNKVIKASDITINNKIEESYFIDDYITLDLSITPSNSSYKSLTYSSTNTDILTVDDFGNVTFISEGVAKVIIEQKESDLTKEIEFNVVKHEEIEPDTFNLVAHDYITSLPVGEVTLIYGTFSPSNVTDKDFYIESLNPDIAGTYGSHLFALKEGEVTIKGTHPATGKTATLTLTITEGTIVKPTTFEIDGPNSITVNSIEGLSYSSTINSDASNIYQDRFYSAYTANDKPTTDFILNITTGEVEKASKAGNYKVYVYSYDWSYYDIMYVAIRNILPKYSISDKRLVIGESYKINVQPINSDAATYFNYEYYIDNEKIASIDKQGVITPKKEGKTLVGVIVDDGIDRFEAYFNLEVSDRVIEDNVDFNFGMFIRKGIAHFMGFVGFGIIAFMMYIMWVSAYYKKFNLTYVVILVNGLTFAILTEVIQLFAPGRDGNFKDVILDFLGYLCAFILCVIIYEIYRLIKKRRKKDLIDDNQLENNEN